MSLCVFVGPTLAPEKVRAAGDFICLPPVAQGDVYRAVRDGARAIGLIDGYFEGVPAVWHKEILWALSQGVAVFGGASMGALRAAELCQFGMQGVGRIFEDFRDGRLEDDDEVAVLHGPAEVGYIALSEAMVNIRATLDRAVADGVNDAAAAAALVAHAKEMFYQQRGWEPLLGEAALVDLSPAAATALRDWLPEGRVDRKAEDGEAMLAAMATWRDDGAPAPAVDFAFEWTEMWEAAVAAAPTAGLDPATRTDAVGPDRLLDELRLDAGAFHAARTAALARLLSLRAADRRGLGVELPAVRDALERLRGNLGLYRRADLDDWMRDNDLSPTEMERLMEDEARLEAYLADLGGSIEPALLDQLRLDDAYTDLATRARDKQTALSAMGAPDPGPEDTGLSSAQLTIWYFENHLGRAVPDDLDGFCRQLGLESGASLQRLMAGEFLFTHRQDIS